MASSTEMDVAALDVACTHRGGRRVSQSSDSCKVELGEAVGLNKKVVQCWGRKTSVTKEEAIDNIVCKWTGGSLSLPLMMS